MTKSKKQFDELFGDLSEQQENVKRRVHARIQQPKRLPKKRASALAAAAFMCIAVAGGSLWWTLQDEEQGEHAAIVDTVLLQQDVYDMHVYGARYFSPNAITEAEAKKRVFDTYVQQQAVILYGQQQGITVTEHTITQAIDDELTRFTEHPHTAQAQYYREMREHFQLTDEQYGQRILYDALAAEQYEALLLQRIGIDATKDAGHEELQRIRQQAIEAYEQKYAAQLQQFKQQHHISDQPTPMFTNVQVLQTVFGQYDIANVAGNDVFASANELTVGWTSGEAVRVDAFLNELYTFGSETEPFVFFSWHTLPQYVELAKQYKAQHPEAAQKVDDFLLLMAIFEQTASMK